MYYVSLDLGSETIAAYYENAEDHTQSGMIDLQEYAEILFTSGKPLYFMENDVRSPRLKTSISIIPDRQIPPLPDTHAILDFLTFPGPVFAAGYSESLFQYFYDEVSKLSREIIPNPKLLFQKGIRIAGGFSSEEIVKHLIVHIVRNFVLKSSQLLNVDPENIHLMITMPNVYSLTHVESIRNFVKKQTGVHEVEAIYESDAVAYFILGIDPKNFPEYIQAFKDNIEIAIKRQKRNTTPVKLNLITIDIGRGTTDLSIITITYPDNGNIGYYVKARTGKSDGGSRLSYIFVKYYEERLIKVFEENRDKISKVTTFTGLPFNFTSGNNKGNQGTANSKLEALIEKVKEKFIEEYDIYGVDLREDEQKELIKPIIEEFFTVIATDWSTDPDKIPTFEDIREKLYKAMILPRKFPGKFKQWFYGTKLSRLRKLSEDERQELEYLSNLEKEIRKYVKENVKDLLEILKNTILVREKEVNNQKAIFERVLNKDYTFAVIAGRASQFNPIHNAIVRELKKWGIIRNTLFLQGTLAKEACCRGAVILKGSRHDLVNPRELYGSYGFLSFDIRPDFFKAVPMAGIRGGGNARIEFGNPGNFRLIYSQKPSLIENSPIAQVLDDYSANIRTFNNQNSFNFEYCPDIPEIKINSISINHIPTFGDIDESIYPKVWPEKLRP